MTSIPNPVLAVIGSGAAAGTVESGEVPTGLPVAARAPTLIPAGVGRFDPAGRLPA